MDEIKQIAAGIMTMLKMKGKEDLLEELIEELEVNLQSKDREVVLESAVELSKSDIENLRDMVTNQLGFQPVLIHRVDPELLGGVKLRIGDTVIDVSLKKRLRELKKNYN